MNQTIQPEMKYLDEIQFLREQMNRFVEIGVALSKEKELRKTLQMIIDEAQRITNSDGATLYMSIDENTRLKFEIMKTKSKNVHFGGLSNVPVPEAIYPIKLYNPETGEPNMKMVSAYVALTGQTVNIEDAYTVEGFDFSGTKAFDQRNNYHSKSFLTVPLKNHLNETIGVIQLINAQDPATNEIISFSNDVETLIESLCSQAAIILTNNQLIKQLEELFESFVKIIAKAIDLKSPYTGGHCQRIPVLTRMLGEAVNRTKEGKYADIQFNDDEMRELEMSAWLHDTGKVATPVHVVDKSTKLETLFDRIEAVQTRFELLVRDEEMKYEKRKQKLQVSKNRERLKRLKKNHTKKLEQIADDREFIKKANIGGEFMSDEKKDRVKRIAVYKVRREGKWEDLLSDSEIYNLSISRGTLTPEERKVINDHTIGTLEMLTALPWPKKLKNVPYFAGAHHEKLDGTGYPKGLNDKELPIQPRIVAIADIFEALTAKDRPYKKAKTLSETIRIMKMMRNEYHIDPELFEIFVKEKVYEEYGKKYLLAEQIDEIS